LIRDTSVVGYADFNDDRRLRYTLRRWLTPGAGSKTDPVIVCFLMLNPSTADAFANDPTVSRCIKFAKLWGADILDVVNLFAFRSPYPVDLKSAHNRGDDHVNDTAIRAAVASSWRAVAAWGLNGQLANRATNVRIMLARHGLKLFHLGLTKDGFPTHPIARGKNFVPYTREPMLWE
jgi:hypothetical protein